MLGSGDEGWVWGEIVGEVGDHSGEGNGVYAALDGFWSKDSGLVGGS